MTSTPNDDSTVAARIREKIRMQAFDLLNKVDNIEKRRTSRMSSNSDIASPISSASPSRVSSLLDVTNAIDTSSTNNDDRHEATPARHSINTNNGLMMTTPPLSSDATKEICSTPATSNSSTNSSSDNNTITNSGGSSNIELTKRLQKLAIERQYEIDNKRQRLKVIQNDASSHLSSIKTFDELNLPDYLLNAIYQMGFDRPSSIQELTLPRIVTNPPRNIIGQAQSGSGKTAAFTIGMLYRTEINDPPTLQVLCVTPTRELAIQIVEKSILPMSVNMKGLKVQLAISQSTINNNDSSERSSSKGEKLNAHIVVGTPGKIINWMKRKMIRTERIKVFVLDEADHMFEEGGHRANSLLIKKKLPNTCQHLLFSATFPIDVLNFATKIINPTNATNMNSSLQQTAAVPIIDKILLIDDEGKPESLVLDIIKQLWVDTRTYQNGSKLEFLADIYSLLTIGQSIIFVSTKDEADVVYETLSLSGYTCSVLHSRVEPTDRDTTMEQFRNGQSNVLITTNVLARGVDVDNVCLVINYDLPIHHSRDGITTADYETYLHRIGRTGRFGRKGTAISFIHDDISYNVLQEIEQHFNSDNTQRNMITQVNADPEALADMIEI